MFCHFYHRSWTAVVLSLYKCGSKTSVEFFSFAQQIAIFFLFSLINRFDLHFITFKVQLSAIESGTAIPTSFIKVFERFTCLSLQDVARSISEKIRQYNFKAQCKTIMLNVHKSFNIHRILTILVDKKCWILQLRSCSQCQLHREISACNDHLHFACCVRILSSCLYQQQQHH